MNDTLNDLKKLLCLQALGKVGIHRFGIRRTNNAVCIYWKVNRNPYQSAVLHEIQQAAPLHQVVIGVEERPCAT